MQYYKEDLDELTHEQLSVALGEPQGRICMAHGIEKGMCPICDCELCIAGEDPDNHDH